MRRHIVLGAVATSAFLLFGAGCKDSNTLVGPQPTPTPVAPTPTPAPASIAGAWVGTLEPGSNDFCAILTVQATFEQNGSAVDGVLDTSISECVASHIELHGTLTGNSLDANITSSGGQGARYAFHDGSTATGTLSATTLTISLFNNNPGFTHGAFVNLHR